MTEREEFLARIKARGLSSPAGRFWGDLVLMLRDYGGGDDSDRLRNPLILAGAVASHAEKHKRLAEHLAWAERHGCLAEALEYLRALPLRNWNQARDEADWYYEFQ